VGVFATSGLVGSPVVIVDGRGKGQRNIVVDVTDGVIEEQFPWLVQPDETSVYQIGGVSWSWLAGTYRWIREEGQEERRVEVIFSPTEHDGIMNIRRFVGLSAIAEPWGYDWPASEKDSDGIVVRQDEFDASIDTTTETGFAQLRISDRRERYILRTDYITVELFGVSGADTFYVYSLLIEGAANE